MISFFSKKNPDILLHQIHRLDDFSGRTNLCANDQFIQCASLKMQQNDTFKPHYHVWKRPTFDKMIAQESWVVISGRVKVIFYDLDNSILSEEIIGPGDASFTFQGGHNYVALDENTLVYEYKTGPYNGMQNDKQHI